MNWYTGAATIEIMGLFQFIRALCLCLPLVFGTCIASTQYVGQIHPGFQGSQMNWIDHDGLFLQSNDSVFALGFYTTVDVTLFVLVIIHLSSSQAVWTANRGLLVKNSDNFVFDNNGNVYLESGNGVVWSTNTAGEKVMAMELQNSGNLVLLGDGGRVIWQSFSHPTDTLLPGQQFLEGMKLTSYPKNDKLFHYLAINSSDLVLYVGYKTPQIYWSIVNENRKTNKTVAGKVFSVSLVSNSWSFYDQKGVLLWQFIFSEHSDPNATWSVVLGSDGSISFVNLQRGKPVISEPTKIPENSCSIPEPCDPFSVCYFDRRCQCPLTLTSLNCRPETISACNTSNTSAKLLYVGEKLNYFALGFVSPVLRSNLNACQEACLKNCSCLVLFFNSSSGSCFLFDQIGSLQRADPGSTGFVLYTKVSSARQESGNGRKNVLSIVMVVVASVLAIVGLLYLGFWCYHKKKRLPDSSPDILEEDYFLESLSGMPARFSYGDLCKATQNFSAKIGQGGFGSVYLGVLPDGTQLAVKKLEAIGQGMKEFRAEVSIIGSVHHVHLVRLKGFCAEGAQRLLVYEYMGKGSLDKWIFKNKNKDGRFLDWNTRFNIALGMAKGLAYLHEECEVKIIHCDIKPENVLLDDNFVAKVSDFGLAKLMNREQSIAYTTLRGTRGYLAPEWITNYAISEKSDVYSYGMVLLEIIGGRKNLISSDNSEKSYFPSYALKMLEGGELKEILDSKLEIDEQDERVITAIKVALWCIQDEMRLRPSMTKVVQMLEGLCAVAPPPTSSHTYSSFFKWSSEEGSYSGLIEHRSDVYLSDVRLSGPR